jgi:hypothetical protein
MSSNPPNATAWFSQFQGFTYDAAADLRSNFQRLAASRQWGARLKSTRWFQCLTALFGSLYGTNISDLTIWQNLCTEVGIPGPPPSITQCKKVSAPCLSESRG